jgi:predicted aspartyl protease
MIKRFIIALVTLASLVGCSQPSHPRDITVPQRLIIESSRAVLPMRRIHGMAVVDAPPVNGEPSILIVDTGSSMAYFSNRVLEAYGRESNHTTFTTDAAGHVQYGQSLVLIDSYAIGSITFENFHAAPLEPTGLRRFLGDSFDGALGMSLFRDCLLTIDYPKRQIVVERGNLEPGEGVIPARFPRDGPPQVEITLAGRSFSASIDSGFEGSLELPRAVADSLGWQTRDRPAYFQNLYAFSAKTRGRLNVDLQIAGHTIPRPRVLVTESGDGITIGSHILQQFALTLDAKSRLIRFAKNP